MVDLTGLRVHLEEGAEPCDLQALRAARDTCPRGHPYEPRQGRLRDCLRCLRERNHTRADDGTRQPCERCGRLIGRNRGGRAQARHLRPEGAPCV